MNRHLACITTCRMWGGAGGCVPGVCALLVMEERDRATKKAAANLVTLGPSPNEKKEEERRKMASEARLKQEAYLAAQKVKATQDLLAQALGDDYESKGRSKTLDLVAHLKRHIAFSRATFGPHDRSGCVADHIRLELIEIDDAEGPAEKAKEWVDVVLLALDGLWRSLEATGVGLDVIPEIMCHKIERKQYLNEMREWPDWRTAPPGPIEHIRSNEGELSG